MKRIPTQCGLTTGFLLFFLVMLTFQLSAAPQRQPPDIYAPENLMAWCIVPFDAKKRGPEERAAMLEKLGIQKLAYDWRAEHVPTFDAEVAAMLRHKIEITAWWFPTTLDADAKAILSVIERHKITPQLWVMGGGEMLKPGKANDAFAAAEAERIKPIAEAAAKLGCHVALYNHGGWFGEPENQLDVIARLQQAGIDNVGIVYNFHHGHDHLPRFGEIVRKMKPHLLAVNINGMVRDGERSGRKILPLSAGDQELEMLRVLQVSGWVGPVGIIDHKPETDSELTLSENLRGLTWMRSELKAPGTGGLRPFSADKPALGTFVDGKVGKALDASAGGLTFPGQAGFRALPIVIQCWTKLRHAQQFNILTACDAKASAEHWELYSFVNTGEFCVFLPGRGGNFTSGVNICDDRWRHVAAVIEENRVRLFVDGALAKEHASKPLQGMKQPGGFAIGRLVEGGIGCAGLIDEVRVARGTEIRPDNPNLAAWSLDAAEPAAPSAPEPAAFFPDAPPLRPEVHPYWQHPVNRDRIYDFYAKQALRFSGEKAELLPSYPGLDGGRYGHWGNQNEEVWSDLRWNEMDAGGVQCGIVTVAGRTIPRAVCIQLGDTREIAACFDTDTLTWAGVWSGGFLRSDSFRWGMLAPLIPAGKMQAAPPSEPADKGSFDYHGYYRHGGRITFAFAKDGTEWLESAWSENGTFRRRREKRGGALDGFVQPGPPQWPQVFETSGTRGSSAPYAVDTLTFPVTPWKSLWHVGGHDFLPDGTAALCTFEGEVWTVAGIDDSLSHLRWRRFASGLSQPLGLKVVGGNVCVLCRDQITRLHDANRDGEADFYEAFSRAFPTPVGGHDYLTGLETDNEGRLHFASGKLGVVRISADGKSMETLATGIRNANGIGVGPHGEVTAAAQEGDWTAASFLTEIAPGGHYRHGGPRPGPLGDLPPTLYFPRGVDNSCGGQVFVPSDKWGLPRDSLIHLSWGVGAAFLILQETVEGQKQGCAVPLPGEFRSGSHRGRFRAQDAHMYVTGCTGWGTYTPDDGCFERLRLSGQFTAPVAVHSHDNGLTINFSAPLADSEAGKVAHYFAQQWNYLISPAYGSDEYSVRWPGSPGHDVLEIKSAHLFDNAKELFLEIPQLQPSHQLHLHCALPGLLSQDFFLTLHKLNSPRTDFPGYAPVAKHSPHGGATVGQGAEPSPFEKGEPGRSLKIQTAAGLQFAQKELITKAGEHISLTLENPDLIPHNWVLVRPGAVERIADAADKSITDPTAFSRSYVPASKEIICHTRLVDPGKATTVHFQVPNEKGSYPFLCTFPGHTKIMRGVLRVE